MWLALLFFFFFLNLSLFALIFYWGKCWHISLPPCASSLFWSLLCSSFDLWEERRHIRATPLWDLSCYHPHCTCIDSVAHTLVSGDGIWRPTRDVQGCLCSSFSASFFSGGQHPSSNPGTLDSLPFSSYCSLVGSFSKTSTWWQKEGFRVPISPSDFLLKGSLGEYLQSKRSTEIASLCNVLISWEFSGVRNGGGRGSHSAPSPAPPGLALVSTECYVAFWRVDSVKWLFSPFLILEMLLDWFWVSHRPCSLLHDCNVWCCVLIMKLWF